MHNETQDWGFTEYQHRRDEIAQRKLDKQIKKETRRRERKENKQQA